ncbi:MAG TPA: hypothetical protein ENL03_01015 [Phycisphaerae bacterium]|nr:hypothetical protein [Phycisphaerae bacterium]
MKIDGLKIGKKQPKAAGKTTGIIYKAIVNRRKNTPQRSKDAANVTVQLGVPEVKDEKEVSQWSMILIVEDGHRGQLRVGREAEKKGGMNLVFGRDIIIETGGIVDVIWPEGSDKVIVLGIIKKKGVITHAEVKWVKIGPEVVKVPSDKPVEKK